MAMAMLAPTALAATPATPVAKKEVVESASLTIQFHRESNFRRAGQRIRRGRVGGVRMFTRTDEEGSAVQKIPDISVRSVVTEMKKGYGAFGGGATLEKSKLDLSQSTSRVQQQVGCAQQGGINLDSKLRFSLGFVCLYGALSIQFVQFRLGVCVDRGVFVGNGTYVMDFVSVAKAYRGVWFYVCSWKSEVVVVILETRILMEGVMEGMMMVMTMITLVKMMVMMVMRTRDCLEGVLQSLRYSL